jgi:hypothetical protein
LARRGGGAGSAGEAAGGAAGADLHLTGFLPRHAVFDMIAAG